MQEQLLQLFQNVAKGYCNNYCCNFYDIQTAFMQHPLTIFTCTLVNHDSNDNNGNHNNNTEIKGVLYRQLIV